MVGDRLKKKLYWKFRPLKWQPLFNSGFFFSCAFFLFGYCLLLLSTPPSTNNSHLTHTRFLPAKPCLTLNILIVALVLAFFSVSFFLSLSLPPTHTHLSCSFVLSFFLYCSYLCSITSPWHKCACVCVCVCVCVYPGGWVTWWEMTFGLSGLGADLVGTE